MDQNVTLDLSEWAGKVVHIAFHHYNVYDKLRFNVDDVEIFHPAHEHIYGEPVWTWADDGSSVTATFSCTAADCDGSEDSSVTLEAEVFLAKHVDRDCVHDGEDSYNVVVTLKGESYSDTHSVTIPAVGYHTTGEKVIENETAATCTADGSHDEVVYCTACGCEFSRVHVIDSATGHSYGEPVWTWSKSYHGASAAFACENCDDVQTVTAKVTEVPSPDATCTADGVMIHTATVEFEGEIYADVQRVPIPAKGHSYGEPTWSWATDGSSATATFTCSEGDDTQVITASGEMISSAIISEATADAEGLERFTATISFGGATFTDTFDKTIPVITPDDPTDPTNPDDHSDDGLCKWCGKDHSGSFWQRIVGFFHNILYFFAHLFGIR